MPPENIYLHPVARAAWVGLLATALNLLPIGQLDGGHILYSFLGERTKYLSRLFVFILVPMGVFVAYSWLVWAALLFFFGMRHPVDHRSQPAGPVSDAAGGGGAGDFHSLFHRVAGSNGPVTAAVKISATIITYNEERNLPRAIESLRCGDEILVVDSGSTDRTVEIAEKLGARVMESPWRGYAKQKNLAAEQAANEWILSLDADESLSEALEGEIWRIKKNGPEFDAYTMPRLAQYLGRWIRHSGWYPDRKVRLYHRQQGLLARRIRARIGEGGGAHRAPGVEPAALHVRFAVGAFEDDGSLHDAGGRAAGGRGEKPTWGRLIFEPPWTFFQTYVLKAGFLDGVEGLAIANMAALYNFVKYAKARFMSPGR